MRRDRLLPPLLIPLAALLAVLPLLLRGPSCGHDLSFHLLSWQDAAAAFAHRNLHPRWAPTPAWSAGEPRFVFYPPLSWTLGALLTLLATHLPRLAPAQAFALTPIAFTWIALSAAGWSMLHLARRFSSPSTATLAATLYLSNPYTLFTAYERTAFAELLAAAWLPLLLAAILPSPSSDSTPRPLSIPATAIPLALLWLTNAPAAVLGSYALLLLLTLRLLPLLRRQPASFLLSPAAPNPALHLSTRAIAATALGLALPAFYLLPAIAEQPWVTISMAVIPSLRPDDNTLFHHTADPFHDQVLHTASLLALILLALTAAALLTLLLRKRRHPALLPLGALTLVIAFLLTPWSLPVWHHLPRLAFLQFPWRLLALLAPTAVLSLALLVPRLRLRPVPLTLAALALPALLVAPAFPSFREACDLTDTPAAQFTLDRAPAGTEATDEYTPTTADNDALARRNPPFRLLPPGAPDDLPPAPTDLPGPAPRSLDLNLRHPATLVLNLRQYPLWAVEDNGKPLASRVLRNDGLLALPLPAGPAHLRLHLRTPALNYLADALSLAALATLLILLRPARPIPSSADRP